MTDLLAQRILLDIEIFKIVWPWILVVCAAIFIVGIIMRPR